MFALSPERRAGACLAALALLLSSVPAAAHIDLLEPEARAHGTAARGDTQIDQNSNLKSGPCGQVTSGRTERVATYAPGQTITVRVREENAHVSYLRVALALDGESFPLRSAVPAGPETQEEASAAEAMLGDFGLLAVVRENNDTAGFVHEIEVTLPRATCQRCTLQVLQFMYDDPAAPYYFQCADVVLAAGGGQPDAGALTADAGASGSVPTPATQGTRPEPGAAPSTGARPAVTPGAMPGAEVAGSAAAASAGAAPPAASESGGEDGCSVASPRERAGWAAPLGLLALGLVALRRRRVGH